MAAIAKKLKEASPDTGRKSSVGGGEPPRTGKAGGGGSENNRKATSLNVGRILETHHQQYQ